MIKAMMFLPPFGAMFDYFANGAQYCHKLGLTVSMASEKLATMILPSIS